MSKQYFKHYELLKDTPNFKAGWPVRWDGSRRKYYFVRPSTWGYDKGEPDIYLDYDGQSYSLEEMEEKSEWFKPTGEPTEYVPAFPSRTGIEEYVYLSFETRLSDQDDTCRAMNELFNDKDFQESLYDWTKYKYEQFHVLEQTNG